MKDEQREIVPTGECLDKEFISIGILPAQSVVHMGERDTKVVFLLEESEYIKEANAIWSAGNAENE